MIDVVASRDHYREHVAPVAALLPGGGDAALVASWHDLNVARRKRYRRIALMQHGAGQAYAMRKSHPNYPGGLRNDAVGLFLTPNEYSADRWRRAYPQARVATVGSPAVEALPRREPGPGPVVALTWHFDLHLVPETRSALPHYRAVLPEIAEEFTVIGTGHPRRHDLARIYAELGIEYVRDFAEVCRRADVLAFDNTSAGFAFAATGRPVVVMDAPWYRPVEHGLRFYEAADVGVRVSAPEDLAPAIRRALELRPRDVEARERALDLVYAYRTGSAERAAGAIREWLQ